ncbi:MAG: PEP-CTERM sorting domain-containing protein [Pseudoalteromonas spongiae]
MESNLQGKIMFKYLNKLALGALLVLSSSTYAGIINYDDTIANTFYDTDTELVWLDTRMTGWTRNSNSSSSGNRITIEDNLDNFADFRIASVSEVRTLMANVFTGITFDSNGNYLYNDSWSRSTGGDPSEADSLFENDFYDLISFAGGVTHSSRYSDSDDSDGRLQMDGLFKTSEDEFGYLYVQSSYSFDYGRSWTGSSYLSHSSQSSQITFITNSVNVNPSVDTNRLWMVYSPKVASVPEPSTLAIFALGFMGLIARKIKK